MMRYWCMVHLRVSTSSFRPVQLEPVVDLDFDRGEAVKASFPTLAAEMKKLTEEPVIKHHDIWVFDYDCVGEVTVEADHGGSCDGWKRHGTASCTLIITSCP